VANSGTDFSIFSRQHYGEGDTWDHPERPDAVSAFLQSHIAWAEAAEVFFVWMRERSVRMPWEVFLRTWRNCLFSDEGPLLVRPE